MLQKIGRILSDSFLKFDFPADQTPTLFLRSKGRLVGFSATETRVVGPIKLSSDTIIQLSGKLNDILRFNKVTFRTSIVQSKVVGSGNFMTRVALNTTSEVLASIEKKISAWPPLTESTIRQSGKLDMPKVISIDDDEDFNKILQISLSKLGVKIETYDNPTDFIKRLKQGNVDACLIDIHLGSPRAGFALIRAMRNQVGSYIPICILSSESNSSIIAEGISMGADEFIVKKGDIKTLAQTLVATITESSRVGMETQGYFQVPEQLTECFLTVDAKMDSVDELGLHINSNHLPARGTELTLLQVDGNFRYEFQRPISFTVTNSWLQSKEFKYGFTLDLNESDKEEYMDFVRKVVGSNQISASQLSQPKDKHE
jgi:DNA-binding response OmpR family regulator